MCLIGLENKGHFNKVTMGSNLVRLRLSEIKAFIRAHQQIVVDGKAIPQTKGETNE